MLVLFKSMDFPLADLTAGEEGYPLTVMVFEPFRSELGDVLCTLFWNRQYFQNKLFSYFLLLTSEALVDCLRKRKPFMGRLDHVD